MDATIKYLEGFVAFDPQINPQKMGECLYCGVALDEGKKHLPKCHYLNGIKLLDEIRSKKANAELNDEP